MTRKPPRSLQQMAAEADTGSDAWTCRYCGCKDWRVRKTWYIEGGNVRRSRVCRNCGKDVRTTTEAPCPQG